MRPASEARPFKLRIDPDRIVFKGDNLIDHPTSIRINLKNVSDSRQTYKIKCTSATIFRVKPTVGFIKVDESVPVRITFSSNRIPPSGRHFFVFFHMETNEEGNPRLLWTAKTKPDGMRKMLCYFEKPDGRPACDEQYLRPSPSSPMGCPSSETKTPNENVEKELSEENTPKTERE